MKLGLSTLLFVKNSIEESLKAVAELGAQFVELIYDMPHFGPGFDPKSLHSLKELADSIGVRTISIHGSFWDLNATSRYLTIRDLMVARTKDSIEACKILGGEVVTVHPGACHFREVEPQLQVDSSLYRKFISECNDYARKRGVKLSIENTAGETAYPYKWDEVEGLLEEFKGLGLTFDVPHAYLAERRAGKKKPEKSIINLISRFKNEILNVHLHDTKGFKDDHLPPGEGEINHKTILSSLKEIGYDGPVIVEVWNPADPLSAGKRGLDYTKKCWNNFSKPKQHKEIPMKDQEKRISTIKKRITTLQNCSE